MLSLAVYMGTGNANTDLLLINHVISPGPCLTSSTQPKKPQESQNGCFLHILRCIRI